MEPDATNIITLGWGHYKYSGSHCIISLIKYDFFAKTCF